MMVQMEKSCRTPGVVHVPGGLFLHGTGWEERLAYSPRHRVEKEGFEIIAVR